MDLGATINYTLLTQHNVSPAPVMVETALPNVTAHGLEEPCYTQEPYPLTMGAKVCAVILYTAISIVAIGGNSIVVFIILKFQRLRTPTNLLILNLALADLLMAAVCIPFTYWAYLIVLHWPFGAFACVAIHFAQTVAVMLASYTLVAISIDRMLAILFPLSISLKLTHRKAFIVLVGVWLVSMGISAPIFFVQRLRPNDNATMVCVETWSAEASQLYGQTLLFLQYLFPLAVLIVTYSGIVVNLWRNSGNLGTENKNVYRERKESVKKMIPMMILISFLYGACWLPQNLLMNILMDRIRCLAQHPFIFYIYWAVHMIAMSHSVVNPVIYYWRNSRFRAGFLYVFAYTKLVSVNSTYESELSNKRSKARYNAQLQRQRLLQAKQAEARLKSYAPSHGSDFAATPSINRKSSFTLSEDNQSAARPDSGRALLTPVPVLDMNDNSKISDMSVNGVADGAVGCRNSTTTVV